MKTYGCIHYRDKGRTACGRVFNRGTMIGTAKADEVSCSKCKRTRLVNGLLGGNVDISRKSRPRRTPRTKLPEAETYCVFCKCDHVGGSTCMGHYP